MAGQHSEHIGSGYIYLKDSSNNAYEAGVLSDVTLDVTADIRELMGSTQFPVLTAITGRKIKLTAKYAQFSSAFIDTMMGASAASGGKYVATTRKTVSTGAATIATADVGSPAGWAFVTDLGVKYGSSGQPFKYNSGTPAAGEYKNTLGSYTFNTGDNSQAVDISYVYSTTAGETATTSNGAIGLSTYFGLYVYNATTQADGTVKKIGWTFPAVLCPSLKFNFRNTDFATQDVEFSVFADASGYVAYKHV